MTATTEYVIVVDEQDREIRLAEKLSAHQQGLLHRAFSVFIFRQHPEANGPELLLQQRAPNKYHSPLLWTNTCCSHPRAGEPLIEAGNRRLQEELGITTPLNNVGWFHYQAHFQNGLCENEIDHVLVGHVDPAVPVHCDPAEVHAYRWVTMADLEEELSANPGQFTPWFREGLRMACSC